MNLRIKVFTAFMAFIIAPLFVLGAITYLLSQHIIEQNYAEQSEFTLKAVGRNINYVLKEANFFSEDFMLRDDIQQVLGQREAIDPVAQTEYERLLQRTFLSYTPAYAVSLYSFNGQSFSQGKIGYQRIPYTGLVKHPVFREVMTLNGPPRWLGPHEAPEWTGMQPLFTVVRVINDKYTLDNRGILLQQFQFHELNRIFNYFGTSHSREVRFMMVNGDGLIMVDNKEELAGQSIDGHASAPVLLGEEYQSKKMKFDGVESVVSTHHLELEDFGQMNWSIVSVTPWAYLSGRTEQVLQWISAITALTLISALLYNLFFVNRIIRFILYVVSSMKKVEIGDLSIRVEPGSKDETSVLARGFNSLVDRIETLIKEVKLEQDRKNKAELMLMQAQIKPHFLFNTLESINALAAQNEGRKVSRMVQRLGTLLRVSFIQKEEIPLSLEIDHVRNYLEIQKYRFEELFDYEIDVPAELSQVPILKLTLQPLLENSIQHGIEEKFNEEKFNEEKFNEEQIDPELHAGSGGGRGMLRIRAEETEEAVVLWIEDNGSGIRHEVLDRFHGTPGSRIRASENAEEGGERIGLGIPNVADRLKIQYGSRYGMMICSTLGQGTLIRCTIPKGTSG
ncbi:MULTISPECIES: cache domain-containing sensor histidine kinase [Paenibacillus]|uniref:cache domain-containing sensor histidine kinase n=1 Tax=Paenibacillus TaxID=44249 RepID=UPI0022B8EDEF|nr:sensor histidine kinase [Paenibacillus caseinilyticus]MCZ8519257.1 sensor histidine kinase [Paenibacillus caseinilyticus]